MTVKENLTLLQKTSVYCRATSNIRISLLTVASYHLSNKAMIVDLPDPEAPTSAVVLFAGTSKEIFFNTGMCGREGYENDTSRKATLPVNDSGLSPALEVASKDGFRSSVSNKSLAAAAACTKVVVEGAT